MCKARLSLSVSILFFPFVPTTIIATGEPVAESDLPFSGDQDAIVQKIVLSERIKSSSDTIYKPPSLYISGKVLYLHRIGIVNTLDIVEDCIPQVGIDEKMKPLKSLKEQTEAALGPKPHICQFFTFSL